MAADLLVKPLFSELCACSEQHKQWKFTRKVCCHLALESLPLKLEIWESSLWEGKQKQWTLLVIVKWSISTLYLYKITNLWKFELNWSSELRDNNERKAPLSHEVVCLQMLDFETSKSNSEVSKWKLPHSRKLRYFRGSRFSQCVIPSTAPHYSLPSKVLC